MVRERAEGSARGVASLRRRNDPVWLGDQRSFSSAVAGVDRLGSPLGEAPALPCDDQFNGVESLRRG